MIFDDTKCLLGEGPLWHPERQQLFWFDILSHRLHTPGHLWQFDTYVSAAGWIDKNQLIIASAKALFLFDLNSAKQTHLCDLEADNPVTRSNDGRADPQGGFWIGTMGINAEPGAGSIWRYYKGELRRLYDEIQISNSICFAPDGTTAYYTDTNTQMIMAQPLDTQGWPSGDPSPHIDLRGTPYRPDGAVVDTDGNLWSAQWGVGHVATYDPQGREIGRITLNATQTSCPAFGGPDLSTLFVTSARVGLDQPADDGMTFTLKTNVTGQAEHRVLL